MAANGGETLDLVRRCLVRQETAWRALFERHSGLCEATVRTVLGCRDRSYAADAVQEAWIDILLHLAQWHGKSEASLGAWIRAVAARRATHLRKRLRRQHAVERHACTQIHDHGAPGGEHRRCSELLDALAATSGHLPPRALLVLRGLVEGKAKSEIAAALGVSERSVRREVAEIRRRANRLLDSVSASPPLGPLI